MSNNDKSMYYCIRRKKLFVEIRTQEKVSVKSQVNIRDNACTHAEKAVILYYQTKANISVKH